ncbi:aspartyl-tRNA synthetase [Plesiocystis pacifica SIR-1]|uniref:Aspartate--tRNA(Asp/Asn) ligase n=1 Tax=Plesiocystis pacifica SIR-1 TaxID=391625 RepID=A6G0A6_9BACT|nr:aspartate--tRNA ligase [Plesiocystis pacifica]EDM80803.1 aspartyl-tRNA synthetase [Plesiocystis pacifica SIR-1]
MSTLLETGRTHTCGDLRLSDEGREVILFGWVNFRRDHGGRIFIDLRDREGLTQVVFGPDVDAAAHEAGGALRSEDCIGVAGKVVSRVKNQGQANPNLATGEIEVEVTRLEVFSKAQTPPFDVSKDDRLDTNENLRLQYRYLDLRRPSLQRNFILRSKVGTLTRTHMAGQGFLELETPYMVKYTPGGARNFLVPSRLNPGTFYALAESPQIFKQLFMVSGFDKYFQITRCFRDEDLRNDRQPEFTQIDVELSFATPERVFEPIEALMRKLWGELLDTQLAESFPRMTWAEAMDRYGSDKPDTRFGLEFTDLTEKTRGCGFAVFEKAEYVKGICLPGEHGKGYGRGKIDKLTAFAKKRESGGAKGLAWSRVEADGTWKGGSAKFIAPELQKQISADMGADEGSLLLFIADDFHTTHAVLNSIRLHLRDALGLVDPKAKQWNFLWVTDFPLFEKNGEGNWTSSHHPFTCPKDEHVELLLSDPGKVLAKAYDLVLNGNEVGGGSIRIHRSDVQAKVFEALGLGEEEREQKFGFLLDAFKYGPPPHGGIALGLDRLAMLMSGAESLRDVIAFPKTQKGQDLMTHCPTPADDAQLAELFIRHRPLPGSEDGAEPGNEG